MLRVLAQREQGYEDIAALMGLSVEEVRALVTDALDELDESERPAVSPPEPTPEAAPEPAAATPRPAEEAEAPKAPEPAPAPPKEPAVEAKAPPSTPAGPKRSSLPRPSAASIPAERRRFIAIAAGALALVVIIAVALGLFGGDSGGDSSPSASSPSSSSGASLTEEVTQTAADSNGATKAILEAVDGSDARGIALFGKVEEGKKEKLALEVAAEGLEPTGKDSAYTIWISQTPQRMLPLVSTEVDKSGNIAGQYEVPVEVLGYLASETFKDLVVTRTENAKLAASLAKATKAKKAPAYTGTEVLRGTVTGPVVGAQIRKEEEGK
ncbi:MAG TPA: hypothetical protein VG518_09070 [Solirubrobacterales bacterium]|nr:hypothetical protein [Solirubrobacterales bacterium]